MTPLLSTRRRAEEFNTLLEGDSASGSATGRFVDQLELVGQLRDLPVPEPRADFTAQLREQLLAAADELLVPSEDTRRLTLAPKRTSRDRRVAVAVGGLAVVGATTSLAVAAQSALPGEMLYPLKRVIESAETQLHASDEAKGETLLSYATDRLSEATALSRSGDLGAGDSVEQVLIDFADQTTVASDLLIADYEDTGNDASIEGLRDFTASSMESLAELEAILPDQARDELQYAARLLDEIDRAAARACPACRGGIDQIPAVLATAGRLSERTVVSVPAPVPGTEIRSDKAAGKGDKSPAGGKQQQGGTKKGSSGEEPLVQVGVPDSAGGGGSGGGSPDAPDPVGKLTDSLTGKGGKQNTGGGGGITGIPEVDEPVDGAVGGVGGVLDDVTGAVDDVLPDVLP